MKKRIEFVLHCTRCPIGHAFADAESRAKAIGRKCGISCSGTLCIAKSDETD